MTAVFNQITELRPRLPGCTWDVLWVLATCVDHMAKPVTPESIGSMLGWDTHTIRGALSWLAKPADKELKPLIGLTADQIWVSGWLTGTTATKYPYQDTTAETRTDDLEREVVRLRRQIEQLRHGYDEEDLPPGEDEIELFQTSREILGRPLTRTEAYHLGKLAGSGFAVNRITRAVEKFAESKSPIRTAYAVMVRGGQGKKAQIKEPPAELKIWQPPSDYNPWD